MEGSGPNEPRREPGREPGREPVRPGHDGPAREGRDKPKPSEWDAAQRKRRNALVIRLVLGLILLVLFVIFVSLNSDSVQVDFIFFETRTPLVWVFLICALVGGLVAFLLGRSGRRASRKYIKELERRLDGRGDRRD